MSQTNVLIVSKGHDYAHDTFLEMFTQMEGITATLGGTTGRANHLTAAKYRPL